MINLGNTGTYFSLGSFIYQDCINKKITIS